MGGLLVALVMKYADNVVRNTIRILNVPLFVSQVSMGGLLVALVMKYTVNVVNDTINTINTIRVRVNPNLTLNP